MDVGIFDLIERTGAPLSELYEQRLKIAELYDRAGFYSYHLAEHHSTPHGLAASPGIFLAALAQRTKRLRFGPMVYLLPFYHPLRLIEEVCMLDQLSGGRLDVGLGRGISPIERGLYGIPPEKATPMNTETYRILRAGLSGGTLEFDGEIYRFHDVPLELRPLQQPHPPLWYGLRSAESAEWCAREGVNMAISAGTEYSRGVAARFWAVHNETHPGAPVPRVGLVRKIVVAPTDEEALAIARRAYPLWLEYFEYLSTTLGPKPVRNIRPPDYDAFAADGSGVAGSPQTVARILREHLRDSGFNYLIGEFISGEMTYEEGVRSIELFAEHVMPALENTVVA
jgi:alkanesulfonate monooxygenase SsuD/methylene tetrahydromethanopterin reductase-like flavin-dependent oxidoreductase (luciferase family)